MFKKFMSLFVLTFCIFILSCTCVSASFLKADKILYNGQVFTSDVNNPFVEAIAIKGQYVLGVGTTAQMLDFQGVDTQMFDLAGKVAIPGLNDAHVHLLPYDVPGGVFLTDPALFVPGPGPTVAEISALLTMANAAYPAGTPFFVVVGEGFIDDLQESLFDRLALDMLAPGHPVLIHGVAGHYLTVSSATLYVAGIADDEPDPFGGWYKRFPGTNIITGQLQEYAIYDLVRRLRSQIPDEYFQSLLVPLFQDLVQMGVTSIQDIPIGISSARYENILRAIDVPVRVRNIGFPYSIEESRNLYDTSIINPFDKINSSGVKWITDGTQQESMAALTQPYADQPNWYGHFSYSDIDFATMVNDSLTGWNLKKQQRQYHMIGDKGVEILLQNMSNAAPDWVWYSRRTQIAHADMIRPDQYADIAAKNLIPLKFPSQFIYGNVWFSRLGPERFSYVQPLKSLIDAGINVALGSDMLGGRTVGGNWSPFLTIKLAVIHPTNPAEAVDLPTALVMHTLGAAYAEYMEAFKGTLQPGKLADIAVLDTNIFDANNFMTLENTRSVLTLVGGDIVWNANVL
jgi:predicted amidohydrolase YtcJ